MTYTMEVVKIYSRFLRQDERLYQISQKPTRGIMSQRQSEAIINNMQMLTNIRENLENYLASSGDLSQYFSNIEDSLVEMKEDIETNAHKRIPPSFLDRLFGSSDIEKMKTKGDVKNLLKLMIANKGTLSKQAFDALVPLSIGSIDKLLDMTHDPLRKPRELTAVILILKTVGEPALEPLISVLKQNYHSRTEAAALALGIINNQRAGESFLEILDDVTPEKWFSRIIAAKYIGRFMGIRAQDPLLKIINKGDAITFQKGIKIIANTLSEIGDQKAEKILIKLSKKNPCHLTLEAETIDSIKVALTNLQKRLHQT